jgi:hypothetical protein
MSERARPSIGFWTAVIVTLAFIVPAVYLLSYGPWIAISVSQRNAWLTLVMNEDPADITQGGFYGFVGPIMQHSPGPVVQGYHAYLIWWARAGFPFRQ